MTIHTTPTGTVTLVSTWGHGKGQPVNSSRPAIVTTDDGDGHESAWSYTGKMGDALVTLARLERRIRRGDGFVAIRLGNGYTVERAPDDFMVEIDGEFVANAKAFPDIIAY